MYNRYIPQSDGSYRRSRVADAAPRPTSHPPQQKPQTPPPPQHPPAPPAPPPKKPHCPPPKPAPHPQPHQPQNVGNFLKNLLPGNFDTADLIILLLLLLLAGDCEEDRSTAMLTLVLYLFM